MYATTKRHDNEDAASDGAKTLRENTRRVKEDLREAVGVVKEDAEEMAHEAGRQVREFIGTAEKSVAEASETLADTIRRKPLTSGIVAVGIGLALGVFFRRP